MDKIIPAFRQAFEREEGYALADVFSPVPPSSDPDRLYAIQRGIDSFSIQSSLKTALKPLHFGQQERDIWVDVFVHYWKSINELLAAEEASGQGKAPDWTPVYTSWKELLNFIHRGYTQSLFEPWTIPLLYAVTKHLRTFAIQADAALLASPPSRNITSGLDDLSAGDETNNTPNLEDCARQINRIFALVTQDRSPPPNRKYGTYYIATLLFRTYFRLNSYSLCKNIIRSINAASAADMPSLDLFPKAHQVGYKYYVGVVAFLDERYEDALVQLESAYNQCLAGTEGHSQAERILFYLVPTQLLVRHRLPTAKLLERYAGLQALYAPLCTAVRRGDLGAFDAALAKGEDLFVRRRVYLTLERGRDVCLRNLFRRVYLSGGFEGEVRRSRFPIAEFRAGLAVVGQRLAGDEVEALVAGLIYKDLVKGYISRGHAMVVLSKKGAFPGTGV